MARKSHFSKGISTLLLIGLVSVTLLPTNAFWGWSTVKSRNFNNAFESRSYLTKVDTSIYRDDISQVDRGIFYVDAEAHNNWGNPGEASGNYIFDSSIQGSSSRVTGKRYGTYRAYAKFSIDANMSGSNKYVQITVKLIFFSGIQKIASQRVVKYTDSIHGSMVVFTPSYTLGSISRDFYVEVTVRVYTRTAWGQTTAKINMANTYSFHLTHWGIQKFGNFIE